MVGIDHSSFPHIVEQIIASLPPRDRFPFRATCRGLRDHIDSKRRDHVALERGYGGDCVTTLFFTYPSGETVPGIRCSYHDDAFRLNDWEKENWENDEEMYKDILVIDALDGCRPEDYDYWYQAGYTFSTNLFRTSALELFFYEFIWPSTIVYLLDYDENIIPRLPDPNEPDDVPRDHFQTMHLGSFSEHLVLTICLYGDCRPFTLEWDEEHELERVTVIFVHKGEGKNPPTSARPPSDGRGMLAGIIDTAAGACRATNFTFVGLVEHAVQLGVMDAPTTTPNMLAHLIEQIGAARSRLKDAAESEQVGTSSLEQSQAPESPPIRLLTNDDYRKEVGDYVYNLHICSDWNTSDV